MSRCLDCAENKPPHACLHGVAEVDDEGRIGPPIDCDCPEPQCRRTQERADRLLATPGNLPRQGRLPIPIAEARAARDRAIAQVEGNAEPAWRDVAWAFLLEYLRTHAELFVDDLWAAGLPAAREDRALGPVILRAAKAGYIEKTGKARQRTRGHLSPGLIWRSLLYQPARSSSGA